MKIKICGLFRHEDISAVNAAPPDYIGFVFVRESRRYVTPEAASRLCGGLDKRITTVGVFRDADPRQIAALYDAGTVSIAQLHGAESVEYIRSLRALRPKLPIIKAVSVGSSLPDTLEEYEGAVDYFLLDAPTAGGGAAFDWSRIPALGKPYFLAGGINEDNLAAALAVAIKTGAYALDISSGVEVGGVKDAQKIANLVKKVRG